MKKGFMEKLLCIGLVMVLVIGLCPIVSVKAEPLGETEVYYGDVDDNGKIDAKDVTMLRRFLVGGWDVKINKDKADLDSDGEIGAKDVTILRRYIAGGWGVTLHEYNTTQGEVLINQINFPDDIFRKFVSDNFDTDHNGTLDEDEISAVVNIDCTPSEYAEMGINREDYEYDWQYNNAIANKESELYYAGEGITSLKGIEYFSELKNLICSYNQISSIDVSNNLKLINLIMSRNKLTAIDIRKNTALENVDFWENKLTSIDVSNNLALEFLDVENNDLSELDITKNAELIELYCSFNNISELNVKDNTKLTTLYCDNNGLNTIDISNNTMMEDFSCSDNNISSLDLSSNTSLKWLYCDSNNIGELDLSNNSALIYLNCKDNSIKVLDIRKTKLMGDKVSCDEGVELLFPCVEHDWVEIERQEATETQNGYIIYRCSECEKTKRVILYSSGADAGMSYYDEDNSEVFVPWDQLLEENIITVENSVITGINVEKAKGRLQVAEGITGLSADTWHCQIESIYLPKTFVSFKTGTGSSVSGFRYWYNLNEIEVDPENPVYDSRDNCNAIIETATNTIVAGCKSTTIPESIEVIGFGAFMSSNIESIDIPGTVKQIDDNAFWDTRELKTVTLNEGIEYIGNSAFNGISYLEEIVIPSSIISIGQMAFSYNSNLKMIKVNALNSFYSSGEGDNCILELNTGRLIASMDDYIPEGTKIIESEAFFIYEYYNRKTAEEIIIPATVERINWHGICSFDYKHICFLGAPPVINGDNFVVFENGTAKPIPSLIDITVPGDYVEEFKVLLPQYADKIIPDCEHEWVETERKEATETEDGYITYVCLKCGKSKTKILYTANTVLTPYGPLKIAYSKTVEEYGVTIVSDYDADEKLIRLTKTYSNGNKNTYIYNDKGQIVIEENYDSRYSNTVVFEIEYDDYGMMTKRTQVNSDGSRYEHNYDSNGREVRFEQKWPDGSGDYKVFYYKVFEYDPNGRCIKETGTSINGNTTETYITEYEYNEYGKQKKKSTTTPEGLTASWETVYDEYGINTKVIVTDSDGSTYEYPILRYDNGRAKQSIYSPGSRTTNGVYALQVLIYEYDEMGRQCGEISYISGALYWKNEYFFNEDGVIVRKRCTDEYGNVKIYVRNSADEQFVLES